MPATEYQGGICGHTAHENADYGSSWLPDIVCAEVLVIFLLDVVGSFEHASSLTFPLNFVEVEVLPSERFMLSAHQQYYDLIRLLMRHCLGFRSNELIPSLIGSVFRAASGLPCFTAYFSSIPLPLRRRVLRGCASRFFTPSFAFVHTLMSRLSLAPLTRAKLSTLQDSLYGTDCCFAPPFFRGILRFSTPSHPGALGACYVAL